MNYISLNGKKSLLIKGLLISELPPITKPLVRTKTEEIDGRDGDIVTKLGYAAYDKKMTIGLFGDYNIDDIIEYFDSEGIVIFSNEPDKYYRYQILQQIDFERLIRFRTATVVFHVQPFKFSAVGDIKEHTMSQLFVNGAYEETKSGVTVSLGAFSQSGEREIQIRGTATESDVEFYIPIKPLTLKDGRQYRVSNGVSGYYDTGGYQAEFRVIKDTPTNANTAGGQAMDLVATRYNNWTQSGNMTCNYIYIKLTAAQEYLIYATASIIDKTNTVELVNNGNVFSRPKITIYTWGNDTVTINGEISVVIDSGYITLDGESLNAYKGDTLLNRKVTGDLKNLRFNPGRNVLTFASTGYVDKIVVENFSRWI